MCMHNFQIRAAYGYKGSIRVQKTRRTPCGPVRARTVCRTITRGLLDFDFIECFTTTFLRAHSWLNWVDEDDDEDEVGLKEKPEDTRYIKKITSK